MMTYFHPRDFDKDQPIIKSLNYIRRFKSYYGINSAFLKLERILSNFEFFDLQTADKLINWNNIRTINYNNL